MCIPPHSIGTPLKHPSCYSHSYLLLDLNRYTSNYLVDDTIAVAIDVLKSRPSMYPRLTKLALVMYMDEQYPHIFAYVNLFVDNSAPVLEQLHLYLLPDHRGKKRGGEKLA